MNATHAGSSLADRHRATLLAAALEYATRGWHVFPLIPGTKRPATPRHKADDCDRTDPWCREGHTGWEARATDNPGRIARAWSARPWGIGIATGPSGLLVIDTDTAKPDEAAPEPWSSKDVTTGEAVLADLARRTGGELPATWTARTTSGGIHRYFQRPATGPAAGLGNSAGRLGWLVDTRGMGGYVAAAPTSTPAGRYEVTSDAEPAPLPAWIGDRLTAARPASTTGPDGPRRPAPVTHRSAYLRTVLDQEAEHVRRAVKGRRNHALFVAAACLGELVAGGSLTPDEAAGVLLDAAAGHIAAGAFTHTEAVATIRSGFRRGARKPRTAA